MLWSPKHLRNKEPDSGFSKMPLKRQVPISVCLWYVTAEKTADGQGSSWPLSPQDRAYLDMSRKALASQYCAGWSQGTNSLADVLCPEILGSNELMLHFVDLSTMQPALRALPSLYSASVQVLKQRTLTTLQPRWIAFLSPDYALSHHQAFTTYFLPHPLILQTSH